MAFIHSFRERRSDLSSCSVSSDACGSLPVFDDHGKLLEYKVATHPVLFLAYCKGQDAVLVIKSPQSTSQTASS